MGENNVYVHKDGTYLLIGLDIRLKEGFKVTIVFRTRFVSKIQPRKRK